MKELDLTFVKMVQEKKELERRNARAKKYSESIRSKWSIIVDGIVMFVSGLSVFVVLYLLAFIG